MSFANDSQAINAKGGTELMKFALAKRIPKDLLDQFQIFVSRVEDPMDETKLRVYWLHDLPGDPASAHLADAGWNKFHRLVFSSNWQMQAYVNYYKIPYSKCVVLQNAIEPVPHHEKPKDIIRLAYWSTPHRGLNLLVPVFEKLCEKYDNIELDVFSSFKIYGWEQRDAEFAELFQSCKDHPKINYYGSIPNDDIKKKLENIHIHAYPSIWTETSCITLMEAMSAGLECVHPNLGALYETAANWTAMYQYQDDLNVHANLFYHMLDSAIANYWNESTQSRLASQRAYANVFYNWESRAVQWGHFLTSLLGEPRELPKPNNSYFKYTT